MHRTLGNSDVGMAGKQSRSKPYREFVGHHEGKNFKEKTHVDNAVTCYAGKHLV